jgi:hypothetical protein
MNRQRDIHSQATPPTPGFWLGKPGRGKGARIKTVRYLQAAPSPEPEQDAPDRLAVRSALTWVASLGDVDKLSVEEQRRFADDYAAALDEIPPNLYPDRPLPTPADFADENWADYWSWPLAGSTSA